MKQKKVLILGVTGMLGHTLLLKLNNESDLDVYGTARNIESIKKMLHPNLLSKIRTGVDAENFNSFIRAMAAFQPDIVINCIGLIKQLPISNDPMSAITVNAQFPHKLSLVCKATGARMIHFSTDCVFDGRKGGYLEDDSSNANDLYGRTKFLGEVGYSHCITIRTSIIGHELKSKLGLVEWFLGRSDPVKGFINAIYSGFPTIEIARIISKLIIPNQNLNGLYHVSSDPISKFELLKIIAKIYNKKILIEPDSQFYCNRFLDSTRFQKITGYNPPPWIELIEKMYKHYTSSQNYDK